MNSRRVVATLATLLAAQTACSTDAPAPVDVRTQEAAAIYGDDDRTDWYAETDERLRTLTDQSIIAMVSSRDLDRSDPTDIRVTGASLGRSLGLCADERFYDQPTGASCSATLIDDDLVLTAGHCATSTSACQRNLYAFRYYLTGEDELAPMTEDDIFRCEEVIVQEQTSNRTESLDYAIIRLDRSATPRFSPAPVYPERSPVAEGDPLIMIGFGSGLPAKIDSGGFVLDARSATEDYFQASVDAFGGNSGSGVFDAQGRVVGILVAGDTDYSYRGGCGSVSTYPQEGGSFGGEVVTYAWRAVEDLCASGYPSERLCNFVNECGDGFCGGAEDPRSCPDDCTAECGDGVCEPGEDDTCIDCRDGVPVGWDCELSWYDAGDGCDCECGILDPDCDDRRQEIVNCGPGQTCSDEGVCIGPDEPVGPEGWTCDLAFYDAGDGCDCGCGIVDPDCADASADVVGCAPGQICSDDALCVDPDPSDEGPSIDVPDDGLGGGAAENGFGEVLIGADGRARTDGCSAVGGSTSGSWMMALGLALAVRRRRVRA